MQACAAGYALTYVTTPKLQLVSCTVIGLTTSYTVLSVLLYDWPPISSSWCQAPWGHDQLVQLASSYSLGTDPTVNTVSTVSLLCLFSNSSSTVSRIRCRGNVFTGSLLSYGRLLEFGTGCFFSLHISGFEPCQNILLYNSGICCATLC
jgi:hypothetical protein